MLRSESDFSKLLLDCTIDAIRSALGKEATQAILFYIPNSNRNDPVALRRSLASILKDGTVVLEKITLRELFQRLNAPYEEKENMTFEEYVRMAKRIHAESQKALRTARK